MLLAESQTQCTPANRFANSEVKNLKDHASSARSSIGRQALKRISRKEPTSSRNLPILPKKNKQKINCTCTSLHKSLTQQIYPVRDKWSTRRWSKSAGVLTWAVARSQRRRFPDFWSFGRRPVYKLIGHVYIWFSTKISQSFKTVQRWCSWFHKMCTITQESPTFVHSSHFCSM